MKETAAERMEIEFKRELGPAQNEVVNQATKDLICTENAKLKSELDILKSKLKKRWQQGKQKNYKRCLDKEKQEGQRCFKKQEQEKESNQKRRILSYPCQNSQAQCRQSIIESPKIKNEKSQKGNGKVTGSKKRKKRKNKEEGGTEMAWKT